MSLIAKLILNALAVYVAAYIVPGIEIKDAVVALIVAIVLGLANSLIKPFLHLVALPISIMTLGLFALVINGLIVLMVAYLVPGFVVSGLLAATLFSLVLSLIGAFLNSLT